MRKQQNEGRMVALIVAIALIIDQIIKLSVKLNMRLYESIHITDWFYIYFTENPGMAFGMEIFGKLFLKLLKSYSKFTYSVGLHIFTIKLINTIPFENRNRAPDKHLHTVLFVL